MKKITAKIIRDWEYRHWERRLKNTRSEYLAQKINRFFKEQTAHNEMSRPDTNNSGREDAKG